MQITKPQIARLQTLYGQLAAHEIGVGTSREARIRWASERLHREIASFSDLSADDAGFLIDSIQQQLGVKAPAVKRPDRGQARRAGLDGQQGWRRVRRIATDGHQRRRGAYPEHA